MKETPQPIGPDAVGSEPVIEDSSNAAAVRPPVRPAPIALIFFLIWILGITSGVRGLAIAARDAPLPVAAKGVDPNVAPWWELTVLPDVGPAVARRIVAFRESRRSQDPNGPPVFASPADLGAVSGIGPLTLRRIGPLLRFDRSAHRVPASAPDMRP